MLKMQNDSYSHTVDRQQLCLSSRAIQYERSSVEKKAGERENKRKRKGGGERERIKRRKTLEESAAKLQTYSREKDMVSVLKNSRRFKKHIIHEEH